MHNFEYHRPTSLDEVTRILGEVEEAQIVAGGMTLIPTLKQRLAAPGAVVDLSGVSELKGVKEDGGNLVVGAMTTHGEVAADSTVQSKIPALAKLAEGIGDPQVRNRGTIGGSIANNDPAADYPAALVGLGATVKTNKREISADDFFVDMFETALEDDEIVLSVSFPVPDKAGYAKFENPASRYAVVGVMVSKGSAGTRVAVTGAGPCVYRMADMESALESNFSADALDGITTSADELNSDMHASAEYRAHLVGVMAKRAVKSAG